MEKEGKQAPNGANTRHDYKLVAFAEGDPDDPKNWSKAFKWYITMVVAVTCFVVAFCSSVITADVGSVAEEFGVSHEAALVPITVFVVGFGVGEFPLVPFPFKRPKTNPGQSQVPWFSLPCLRCTGGESSSKIPPSSRSWMQVKHADALVPVARPSSSL